MTEGKIGKVLVSIEVYSDFRSMHEELYAEMGVIEETHQTCNEHEYVEMLCERDEFEHVSDGDEIPYYMFTITKDQKAGPGEDLVKNVNVWFSIKFTRLKGSPLQ